MTDVPLSGGLLAALGPAMSGPLLRFAGGLVGPDDPRPSVAADRLLDADMLAAIAAPFEGRVRHLDRRALVSVWTLTYFETILPPLLAAHILLDRAPDQSLGDVGFVIAPDGGIAALKLRGEQSSRLASMHDHRFHGLVAGHLAPFIGLVAQRGGVTPRVLWSNAGHIFEVFLSMLKDIAAGRPGLADARHLLASPQAPWGGVNQLYRPVRYVDGRRLRRVCCLRLLVPEWRVCAICPAKQDGRGRAAT